MADDLKTFQEARSDVYLSGGPEFDNEYTLIFRFVVRSFFKERPKTGANKFIQNTVAFLSEDLSKYYVLGVTLKKLEPLLNVAVHSSSYVFGTTDKSVLTDEASWIIDVVLRPAQNERAWTNPERWTELVATALQVWGGYRPQVDIVGVVRLPQDWLDKTAHFNHVYAWWNQRQPVYYVQTCTAEQLSDPKYKGKCPSITNTPFNSTAFLKGKVGDDGLGFAAGLADYPDTLQPINVLDTTRTPEGLLPPDNGRDNGSKPDAPDGPDRPKPKGKTEQYLVFGAFAAVGYVLYQKMLKDYL